MGPSMLDNSKLELTDFINPELTWNRVRKGFRSSSRRSRKPARTLNVGVQHDDKSTKRGESSVSESEKLGVAVLGRRFAEKIKHVPIKKRRPLLQSPSTPPRTPSPHREESISSQPSSSPQPEDFDQTIENKCVSSPLSWSDSISNRELETFSGFPMGMHLSIKNDFVNRKRSISNGKLGDTADFSGIALLAAAACSSSIIDDAHNVKKGPTVDDFLVTERTATSISATVLEKTTKSLESGNLFLKESAHEDGIDDSVIRDNSVVMSQNLFDKGDSDTGKRSSSKKDDRLHWDLNTVMEAWELPCDDLKTGSEYPPDDGVHGENPEKLEGSVSYRAVHASELLKCSAAKTEVSTQVVSMDKSPDTLLFHGSEPISNGPLSKEKLNTSPTSVIIQTREACSGTSAVQLDQKLLIEDGDLGKQDVFLLDTAISGKGGFESDNLQSQEVSMETLDLLDNRTSATELVTSASCQMSEVEYCASISGKLGLSIPSPVPYNSSGLGTTFIEEQPVVTVDVEKKQDKEDPTAHTILMDSSLHFEMKELLPKSYECFGKVDLADPTDDGKGLDVSLRGHGPTVSVEKMTQIEGGYESPFEDGELRELVVYSCEENEVDDETECVDYDSDYRAANQCMSEVGSDSYIDGDNGGFQEKELLCGRANSSKESSHSSSLIKFSGQNQLPEDFERTTEANNIGPGKKIADESRDGLHVVGSAGEVGSRASRGVFPSNVEGTSCSETLYRKGNGYMHWGRYDTCFQSGRMFDSEKYMERDRSQQHRNQGDSRNCYQTSYTQRTQYPRPRSIANSGAKIDGLSYRDQRRYTDYSTKGEYRPHIRQRSPPDSDDGYSASRRVVSARENIDHIRGLSARENIDHIRSRGRGRIYGQGFSRVPREEYDGPVPLNPASSSVRPRHYFSRGEHSFSPILGRGASFSGPHGNPRSRSRSRSPLTFRRQRERNTGMRRLSRSPEFRSDARMGRGRMSFQKSNCAADDEDGFISPPRTRFSPQGHTRWIDDENCRSNNFVERKPPGRLFGGSQKFDSGGSRGRIKSDECFRPMIRPGRFTENSDGGDRGHKSNNGNWGSTKYHDKYENVVNHGLRRCNTSGALRRFCIDEKGCSMLRNTPNKGSSIRGTDRPRSAREGRSPFRHSSERINASGPKLSRICDSNDDV